MMKRILATLLAAVMLLGAVSSALAEYKYEFDGVLAPELSMFKTPGEAVKVSNHTYTAAVLYLELILYQNRNDIELESRALWNDCMIGRVENRVVAVFDLEGEMLLVLYDVVGGTCYMDARTFTYTETTVRSALEGMGASSISTVDGNEWTDVVIELLSSAAEE